MQRESQTLQLTAVPWTDLTAMIVEVDVLTAVQIYQTEVAVAWMTGETWVDMRTDPYTLGEMTGEAEIKGLTGRYQQLNVTCGYLLFIPLER